MPEFGKSDGEVFNLGWIVYADFRDIEQLKVYVKLFDGTSLVVRDIEALELAMQLKPSVIEGRKMRHHRHAWAFHNLIGHPLMQLLAIFKLYRWAFYVHDHTVPKVKSS